MKINSNMDVSSKKYSINQLKDSDKVATTEQKSRTDEQTKESIGASLQRNMKGVAVRTEEELNDIINKLMLEKNEIEDADNMVLRANMNILNNSNDAVLAQANSTSERVAELLN